jgi:hypothetical protein
VGILCRNASLRERAYNAAGSCSRGCANRRRGQPTSCDNRSEAGDRQQAEPGKKAGSATYARTYAGAFPSAFGAIADAIAVAIHLVGVEPAVRIIGNHADVRARHACGFEAQNSPLSVIVVVVKPRNGNRHVESFCYLAVLTLP